MKKTLLFIASIWMTVAASAQIAAVENVEKLATPKSANLTNVADLTKHSTVFAKSITSKRTASVTGTYVLDAKNSAGDFTSSSMFSIEDATGTISLDMFETDEKGNYPTFDYNVKLVDFTTEGAIAYGMYDAQEGTILIPVQTILTHNTYGRIIFSAVVTANGAPQRFGYNMILNVDEDGSLQIDGGNLDEEIEAGELPVGSAITGWWNYLPDYEAQPNAAWNRGYECEFFAPNAVMSCDVSGHLRTDGETSGWQDERAEYSVAVEDMTEEILVHNFLGMTAITINVNDDGTCSLPLPQYVDDYDYSEDGGFEYGCMRLVGMDLDGNMIKRNYDKTSLPGKVTVRNGVKILDFFDLDEEGHVVQDETHSPYLAVATASDSDGAAYAMGNIFALRITIPVAETQGINEAKSHVNNTSLVYNMMGQKVNSSSKGLLVRDGKKLFVK